jgi:hypothetical protein
MPREELLTGFAGGLDDSLSGQSLRDERIHHANRYWTRGLRARALTALSLEGMGTELIPFETGSTLRQLKCQTGG